MLPITWKYVYMDLVWFEYFCKLKCSMPSALFTISKVITFKGIWYIPTSNCSLQLKNKIYFEYFNKNAISISHFNVKWQER